MNFLTEFDDFEPVFNQNNAQIGWNTVMADLKTPVSAMLKIARLRLYSFLLESVEGGAIRGRYSFIGLNGT